MAGHNHTLLIAEPTPLTAAEKSALCNRGLHSALLNVAVGVAVLYALLSTSHFLLLPPEYKWNLFGLSITNFALLICMSYYGHNHALPAKHSRLLGSVILLMLIINSGAHLGLSGEMKQSSNMALIVVSVGCFFLSYTWWASMVGLSILTWAAVTHYTPIADPDWVHYAFMNLICLILSFLVILARRKSLFNGEMDQRRDALRVQALENALENINTLEGFIPICAWCKKIRDDEGFWA